MSASASQIRANRANARASTGPRTVRGKSVAAQNARRHGLSVPIARDRRYASEIATLTGTLAGPEASPILMKFARPIAEAQITIIRIRLARKDFIARSLDRKKARNAEAHEVATKKYISAKIKFVAHLARTSPNEYVTHEVLEKALGPAPSLELCADSLRGPDGLQMIKVALSDYAKQLSAFDRYERRALSCRKFAIRRFDEVRRNLKLRKGPL
jgi:hypothetical protein